MTERLAPGVQPSGYAALVSFVCSVPWLCPGFLGDLESHLEEMDGEVLPNLLLADYCSTATAMVGATDLQPVRRLSGMIEEALQRGVKEISDAINVSFVEPMPHPGELGHEVVLLLGPLARQFLPSGTEYL